MFYKTLSSCVNSCYNEVLLTQKHMQNMPEHIEQLCLGYVDSLPGLRAKAHRRELRAVRSLVGKVLHAKGTNPSAALETLAQWTKANEDRIIGKSLKLNDAAADELTGALNAVANLNAVLGAELMHEDSNDTTEVLSQVENLGVTLSVAEEKMIHSLGLQADLSEKLREKVKNIKSGNWKGLQLRNVLDHSNLKAVSFGKLRILFDFKTTKIHSIGFRKDVYDHSRARN